MVCISAWGYRSAQIGAGSDAVRRVWSDRCGNETTPTREGSNMSLIPTQESLSSEAEVRWREDEEHVVRAWRTEQLRRLGLSRVVAELFADHVDWHDLAKLTERGCPLDLALRIVR